MSNCSGRNSSFSSVGGGAAGSNSSVAASVAAGTGVTPGSAVINAANVTASAGGSGGPGSGEPNIGPLTGGGNTATAGLFKYIVYKQPLSLDRFYIHDILPTADGPGEYLVVVTF